MDPDVIGAAAAVEALKITASDNQPQGGGGGRRPNSGYDNSEYSNAPSGGLTPNKPAGSQKPSYDEDSAPPASKGGMQDKMVGVSSSLGPCVANISFARLHWRCPKQASCSTRRTAEAVVDRVMLKSHKVPSFYSEEIFGN